MKANKFYIILLSVIVITSGFVGVISVGGNIADSTGPSDVSVHYTIVNSSSESISITGEMYVDSNHNIKSVELKRGTPIEIEKVNSSTYKIYNFTHSSVSNTTEESIFELPRMRIEFENGKEYTTIHSKTNINTSVNNTYIFTSPDGVVYQTQYEASKNVYKNMTYITPDSRTVDKDKVESFYTETELYFNSSKPIFVFIGSDNADDLRSIAYKDSIFIKKPNRLRSMPHELLHVYQTHTFGEDMQWAREAFPNYLRHYIFARSYNKNQSVVEYRNEKPLFNKTNGAHTSYTYGSKVLHSVDIRLQKNTNKTMYDIFIWMNAQNETITYEMFRQKIVSETNQQVGNTLDRHVYHGEPVATENYHITPDGKIVRKTQANTRTENVENKRPRKEIAIEQKLNESS